MITSADIHAKIDTAVKANGIELAEGIDIDAITREVIDTYGLIDIDGWNQVTGNENISFEDFWAIVQRHDSTQQPGR